MKSLRTLALALLALLAVEGRSSTAQPRPRAGIVIVVVWPVAGPVQGVGVNGKVVWPRWQAGRRIPTGNTVIIWPRAQPRR